MPRTGLSSTTGRYVAFESKATNLVPHDTNSKSDVFVRDPEARRDPAGVGELARTAGQWQELPTVISASGRYVAFDSGASNLVAHDTNGKYDVFVRDRG